MATMEKASTIRMRVTTTIISISENPRSLREDMNPFFLRGGWSKAGSSEETLPSPAPICHLGVERGRPSSRVTPKEGHFHQGKGRWLTRMQAHRKEGTGERQSTKGRGCIVGLM